MGFCDEKRYRHGYFYKWCELRRDAGPENLERLAVDLDATPSGFSFGPVIFERNRPLAPAPARGAGRGVRPTLAPSSAARLPEPAPGVPPAPGTLSVATPKRKNGHNPGRSASYQKPCVYRLGDTDAWPQAA